MRDRVARGTVVASVKVNELKSFGAEAFYKRLWHLVDDFGRFDGDLITLRGTLYPRKPEVTLEEVGEWLDDCVRVGLLQRYSVCGASFIQVVKFDQRMRAAKSRYPGPDGEGPCPCCGVDLRGQMSAEQNRTEQIGTEQIMAGLEGAENKVGGNWEAVAVEIYGIYPTKVGKPDAVKAIGAALRKVDAAVLRAKTAEFAKLWAKAPASEMRFCPHPATWFRQERYNDDSRTWSRPKTGAHVVERNQGTSNEGASDAYK